MNTQSPPNYLNDFMTTSAKSPSDLPNAILDAISAYTDKRKKPKRNRSAFILFSIDIRKKQIKENLEELNPNDRFVRIAQLWKEASEEEKKYYEEKAKEEKERYATELNDFCRIFPTEPIQRPRNHIKKPCNAYGYFLKEMKDSIRKDNPELRMCEVLRIVGEKWKTLEAGEKARLEKKAEISRQHFKEEVSKQMNVVKKVKVGNGVGTIVKENSPQVVPESLVRRDMEIPVFVNNNNNFEEDLKIPEPTRLMRSTSTDKKNLFANLSLPNNNNASQGLSQLLNNFGFSSMMPSELTMPIIPQVKETNPLMISMLEKLFYKVDGLRNLILHQLQSARSQQGSPQNIPQDYSGYQAMNVSGNNSYNHSPYMSEGDEYKKEEC